MALEYYAGIDLGGTNMRVCVAVKDRILYKYSQPTPKTGPMTRLPDTAAKMIYRVISEASLRIQNLGGIGISTCSPFININYNNREARVIKTPNICGAKDENDGNLNDWEFVPLDPVLEERFPGIPVKSDNDCVSSGRAEYKLGIAKGVPNFGWFTWSTGIGGALFADGRMVSGKQGNAGHFGHITMQSARDVPCGCGGLNHLEALAAGPAIENRYNSRNHWRLPKIDCQGIFDAYRKGRDPAALETVKEAAAHVGDALASVVALTDTKLLVLGGSVWNDSDVLQPLLEHRIHYYGMPSLTKGVEIKTTAMAKHVGDVAALCNIVPDHWIEGWQKKEPWKDIKKIKD